MHRTQKVLDEPLTIHIHQEDMIQCGIVLHGVDKSEVLMIVNITFLEAMTLKITDSIALFGTYCISLANAHSSNRYEAYN